jgi:hypothetical protein
MAGTVCRVQSTPNSPEFALTDEPCANLQLSCKHSIGGIEIQNSYRRLANFRARCNHARLSVEKEMKVPAQNPWLVLAWIAEWLLSAVVIAPRRPLRFCQIATGTTQSQVAQRR